VLIQEYINGLCRTTSHFAVPAMKKSKGLVKGPLKDFVNASEVTGRALFPRAGFGAEGAPRVDFGLSEGLLHGRPGDSVGLVIILGFGTEPSTVGTFYRRPVDGQIIIPPPIPAQKMTRGKGGGMCTDRRINFRGEVVDLLIQGGTGPPTRRDPGRGRGLESFGDLGPISFLPVFDRGRGGLSKGKFHLDTLVVGKKVITAHLPVNYQVLNGVAS
jgi:hypothetical protein